MLEPFTRFLDALVKVKLLPAHPSETDVLYGYVGGGDLLPIVEGLAQVLQAHGYEVHRCEWQDEAVLLAIDAVPHPLAIRLTASASERYNLYALSRPANAQMLWQWAQRRVRHNARSRRVEWS